MKKIKALIFDIGGVLALNKNPIFIKRKNRMLSSYGVHSYIAKKMGISLDQWFDSADETYIHSFEGKISYKKTIKILSKNTSVPEAKLKKIIIDAYKKNFRQNKEFHNFVYKLKRKGYKIAVLSDQWHPSKEAIVTKKYYKKFDLVILSCDVGLRKPNPSIYRLVFNKLKLRPNETVFIDNQIWNIKPAKKLGAKTILFKNNKQVIKEINRLLR